MGFFRQLMSNIDSVHKDELAIVLGLVMLGLVINRPIFRDAYGNRLVYIALGARSRRFAVLHNMLLGNADEELVMCEAESSQNELERFKDSLVARSAGLLDVDCKGIPYIRRHRDDGLHNLILYNEYKVEMIHRGFSDSIGCDKDAQRSLGGRLPTSEEITAMHFEVRFRKFFNQERSSSEP